MEYITFYYSPEERTVHISDTIPPSLNKTLYIRDRDEFLSGLKQDPLYGIWYRGSYSVLFDVKKITKVKEDA